MNKNVSSEIKKLRSRSETKDLLGGISDNLLHKLMKNNKIAFIKIGDRPFFRDEDIEAFLEQNRRPAKAR